MKFLKSLLMGTGAVVLAGLVLALLAPQAVHAVVATAVQIVNTSASPAITEDTSRQASQIVTIQCVMFSNVTTSCFQSLPNGGSGDLHGQKGGYVVPANQYFVLKSIDIDIVNPDSATDLYISLLTPQGLQTSAEPVPISLNGQVSFASGIVAGPGMEVFPLASSSGVQGEVTLHGYLTPN
jgi:hypothetical protein